MTSAPLERWFNRGEVSLAALVNEKMGPNARLRLAVRTGQSLGFAPIGDVLHVDFRRETERQEAERPMTRGEWRAEAKRRVDEAKRASLTGKFGTMTGGAHVKGTPGESPGGYEYAPGAWMSRVRFRHNGHSPECVCGRCVTHFDEQEETAGWLDRLEDLG